MTEKQHVVALRRAIEIAGSQERLAQGIRDFFAAQPSRGARRSRKFSQQNISYWLREGVLIDPRYWPAIAHVTGGQVTAVHLRPDVFQTAEKLGSAAHV